MLPSLSSQDFLYLCWSPDSMNIAMSNRLELRLALYL